MKKFENVLAYVEGRGIVKTSISFDEKILDTENALFGAERIELPDGATVLPGFVDQHIHGAGGYDAMDADRDALSAMAKTIASEGTTSFLATTMTQSKENISNALREIKSYREEKNGEGARIVGVHLEGPFIAASHKGAQPLEYIAAPSSEVFDEYNAISGGAIKIVTLAPEENGAKELISHLKERGIVASIGHSSAKYHDVVMATEAGASNVTHTYNAQSALHHREIGVVGSAMLIDELNCELIADTIHVSVPAMKVLIQNKPKDKVSLITDAMRAKGLADGESELGGQKVFVKGGEARLADGTLAGSVLRMNVALKNIIEKVGISYTDAVDMATINPARMIGISDECGSIKTGKRADFAVLDKDFNVIMTVSGGKIVYKAE